MSARPRLSHSDRTLIESALTTGARSREGRTRTGCPLCERIRGRADYKQSLYLHADGGWVCFRCGAAGWLTGSGPSVSRGAYARTEVLEPEQTWGGEADPNAWRRPPAEFLELYDGEGGATATLALHRQYITARGIDVETARLAHLGGCVTGRLAWHVVLPVLANDGPEGAAQWKGWVARALFAPLDPYAPIYREPAGTPKGTYFYREEILDAESASPAFVVEGVFDALPLWPDAVACLGKVTGHQFNRLLSAKRPVVFIPDGDAWRAGDGFALALKAAGLRSGSIRLPPRIDPDEIPAGVLRAAAEEAIDSTDPVTVPLSAVP